VIDTLDLGRGPASVGQRTRHVDCELGSDCSAGQFAANSRTDGDIVDAEIRWRSV